MGIVSPGFRRKSAPDRGEEHSLSGGQASTTGRSLGDRSAEPNGGGAGTELAAAEAGMAEMSQKFREKDGEIYLPAAD